LSKKRSFKNHDIRESSVKTSMYARAPLFAQTCAIITRQAIELQSYSNPLKMMKIL